MSLLENAVELRRPTCSDQSAEPAADIEKAACIIVYVAICRRFPPGPERDRAHAWLARLQATPPTPA
jgi:hypothetical protein